MPNPYDDIFNTGSNKQEDSSVNKSSLTDSEAEENDDFITDGKEPLDEIAEKIQRFDQHAEAFAQLLSKTNSIDHKVSSTVERLFLDDKSKVLRNLAEERTYHNLLQEKFEHIIVPMRSLAKIHLEVVEQFNKDIDQNYFSTEKTDHAIEIEKFTATNNINIQRKILADAANDLNMLKDALDDCESRISEFINAGGANNISSAEYEIIVQKRLLLTDGKTHQLDYAVFNINLIDKTVISLGLYMQETSSQYFGKLMKAFEIL